MLSRSLRFAGILFCGALLAICVSVAVRAEEGASAIEPKSRFTLFFNGFPYTHPDRITPCYPVMARFYHPDPRVTTVRMKHPYNDDLYRDYPVNVPVHIDIHENFMKQGYDSYSDFIALDRDGNSYGSILMIFIPPRYGDDNQCAYQAL